MIRRLRNFIEVLLCLPQLFLWRGYECFANSASNDLENSVLLLYFNNTNDANVGDATGVRGSSTAGSFYVSLHTSDPGETGDQTTNETGYTGYARVAVARSSGGFTVSGTAPTQAANAGTITFGQSSTSSTITHFGVGTASTLAGRRLWNGALGSSLAVANLITPSFAIGALVITCD